MKEANRTYDVIVFGASGYTGCYVIKELVDFGKNIKWCVAGRNPAKVKNTLETVGKMTGENLEVVEIIEADVAAPDSILSMCQQTKLLINCVGPYRFFGEKVVDACVESGTHHIDVSGEPQFLEKMQLKHYHVAKEKKIYIVGACGFDSIPCDLGVDIMKKRFKGDINSIETYLEFQSSNDSAGNSTTWESAIHGLAHSSELKPLRRELQRTLFTRKPPIGAPAIRRPILFKSNDINKWCIPFIGSDKTIVLRSQMFDYQFRNIRPAKIQTFMGMQSLTHAVVTLFMGLVFLIMAKFQFGRKLLEKYPEFFSCGTFTKDPPMKKVDDGSFQITIKAKGWSQKLQEPSDEHFGQIDRTEILIVKGPEAYSATAICVVNSAFVILTEKEKLPEGGGVLTPGAAFHDTTLSERLTARGFSFVHKN